MQRFFCLLAAITVVSVASVRADDGSQESPTDFAHTELHTALSDQSETFPWPFVLHLQHDKPLVVEGRVLDPAGKSLGEAHVAVIAQFPRIFSYDPHLAPQLLGQATTDGSGTFHLSGPSLPLHQCRDLYVIARCSGYGLSIERLDVAALRHEVTFRLREEQPIRGRLTGPDGRPARDVQVHVRTFAEARHGEPVTCFASFWTWEKQPLAWPEPPTSDEQGRFVIRGVPRSAAPRLGFRFLIDDPRFAPHNPDYVLPIETMPRRAREGKRARQRDFWIPSDGSEEISIRLEAPRIVEGTVICRDTKEPMAGAWVGVIVCDSGQTGDLHPNGPWVRADRHGRFRARCRGGEYLTIYVYPPPGVPYPSWVEESAPWLPDTMRQEVTVEVPRGVLVRGKVVEADSGAPVAEAGVKYMLYRKGNPYYNRRFSSQIFWAAEYRRILTDSDGAFQMAVVPGPGHLKVKAPTPDFVSRFVSMGELHDGIPSSFWYVINGLARVDPKRATKTIDVTIPLRRGMTVRGRVAGPQGQVVQRAELLGSYPRFSARDRPEQASSSTFWPYPVRSGRFELPGCDPAKSEQVHFLDAEHQWGATVTLDAKAQREPLSVRLLPCGSAAVRFVDENNRPWADHRLWGSDPSMHVDLVFTDRQVNLDAWLDEGRHVRLRMDRLDRAGHRRLQTDTEGRVTFPTLIPGAPYVLSIRNDSHWKENELEEREIEFIVESGQTTDLGEIIVKRPKK